MVLFFGLVFSNVPPPLEIFLLPTPLPRWPKINVLEFKSRAG